MLVPIVLAVMALVRCDETTVRATAPPRAARPAWLVSVVSASSTGHAADAGPATDAPFVSLPLDLPPPPATGAVARSVAAWVCPHATNRICTARRRHRCEAPFVGPSGALRSCEDDVEDGCTAWANATYGDAPDLLALPAHDVARCLDAIDVDVQRGVSGRGAETVAPLSVHAACDDLAIEPVVPGEGCRSSARCEGGVCRDGVCLAYAGEGEPCDVRDCSPELGCVALLCEAPVPTGGACDDESICTDVLALCRDGVCARPAGGCSWDGDCASVERCVEGACVPGAVHCFFGDECGWDRTCVGERHDLCAAAPGVGDTCHTWADCVYPLSCEEGRCATDTRGAGRDDEPCVVNDDCGHDLVCASVIPDGRCAPAVCGAAHAFSDRGEVEDCH